MHVTETVVITAEPDVVWRIVGDAGAIADWVPAIETSRLEGDVRHATFAGGGGDATERIVEHDDAGRLYVYEYLTGPLALERYRSQLAVQEHAHGAFVVWDADFAAVSVEEEAALAEAISGIYRGTLDELKERVEH